MQAIEGFGNSEIGVTTRYLTRDGKPWLPVMGELHYSRVPETDWAKELRKMKAGGINIVSSYVFWNHHEAQCGTFCWERRRNIRKFIQLCDAQGLDFFLRPGPWAHGECRNGGFPDWLLEKCGENTRCQAEPYLSYVRRYFEELANQVAGLPNIIGIQVENELVNAPEHLSAIKQILLDCGFRAPLFTATGWGAAPQIPAKEMLPVYGGYPEAPWEQHTRPLEPNSHSFFSTIRNDNVIGNDLMPNGPTMTDADTFPETPFMTCEVGAGNQVTYHRRPIIKAGEVTAMAVTLLGGGCNLLGYYMYHGGVNPLGDGHGMQESKESGYPNDYPVISYDFQAPLGDCGQYRESYFTLLPFHRFLAAFGELLAPMQPFMPDVLPVSKHDTQTLRCAVRSDGEQGFLFINNYQRLTAMPEHEPVELWLRGKEGELWFPIPGVKPGAHFILPFGLRVGTARLRYGWAQPLSRTETEWTFLRVPGMEPRLFFEEGELLLTEEPIEHGGVLLRLEEPTRFFEPGGWPLEAVPVANTLPFDWFRYLGLDDLTHEWKVEWEGDASFLRVRCHGNVAQAYCEGRLVSDWFCNGQTWTIDVRGLPKQELILKIQPLTPKEDLYFETEMPTGVHPPVVENLSLRED